MLAQAISYASSALIAFFTLGLASLPVSSMAQHSGMSHGATPTCVQSCTPSDRPKDWGKLNASIRKKLREPLANFPSIAGTLLITAYYTLRSRFLYTLASWRPPDKIVLYGLYRSAL